MAHASTKTVKVVRKKLNNKVMTADITKVADFKGKILQSVAKIPQDKQSFCN